VEEDHMQDPEQPGPVPGPKRHSGPPAVVHHPASGT
jgi:hypothetical protein